MPPPDLRLGRAEVHVGELVAEREHEVGRAHAPLDRGGAERADVDAHVQRVIHREDALREHRRHDGRAELLREAQEILLRALAEQLDAADQDRALRRADAHQRVGHRLGELALVRARTREAPVPFHDGLRRPESARRPCRGGSRGSRAGARPARGRTTSCISSAASSGRRRMRASAVTSRKMRALRLDVLRLMVHAAELLLGFAGPARDDQQRHLLGIGARDRVHDVVAARAVGDAEHAELARAARVAVRGEAHRRLVGEGHDLEPAGAPEAMEEPEHEVAGQTEDVRHAGALQIGDEEVAERHQRAHRGAPRLHRLPARARGRRR